MSVDVLKQAAAIGLPWGTTPLPPAADIDAAATVLARNKASFMAMERRFGEFEHPVLLEQLAKERQRFDAMRGEFERIRLDFEENGIRTILFKSTGLYPAFAFLSSNLDVLIEPGKGERARRRLHALGYTELLNVEEPDKYLFRRFPSDGTLDTFHLHDAVGWGVPFVDVDDIWSNARPADDDPDILIPGPREALLITLAHWFYEDKTLSLQNLYYVADTLRKFDGSLDDLANAAERRGWRDGFFAALRVFDRAWENLFGESALTPERRAFVDTGVSAVGGGMRAALGSVSYDGGRYPATVPFLRNKVIYYQKILRDPQRGVARRISDVMRTLLWAVRWKLHLRPQKPMLVTFSGTDGSGKTIQAEKLADVLDTCDIRNRTVWSRGASSRGMGVLIRIAKRMFGSGSSSPSGKSGEAAKISDRRASLSSPLRRRLFAFFFGLELALVYAVRVRWMLLRGNIVICDRYVYDAATDIAVTAGISAQEAQRLLAGLFVVCPKPSLAFWLDVDENDALARKPDEGDKEHLTEARQAFSALAADHNLLTVPANLTIDDVFEGVHTRVLRIFYDRYRTLLNWLLASDPSQLNPGKWRA